MMNKFRDRKASNDNARCSMRQIRAGTMRVLDRISVSLRKGGMNENENAFLRGSALEKTPREALGVRVGDDAEDDGEG